MTIIVLGKIISIFGISYLMKLFKVKSFNMKFSHKGIMSYAGSIRRAIAFVLAISIDSKNTINK
jgi:hypothetical protein